MRLNLNSDEKIVAALAAVNSKALSHTYTLASELRAVARDAEEKLAQLNIPKAMRAGAVVVAESGERLPNKYKYQATTTLVYLERGSSGWFLTSARRSEIWPDQKPHYCLRLTEAQDRAAIDRFRAQYARPTPVQMVSL